MCNKDGETFSIYIFWYLFNKEKMMQSIEPKNH